MISEPRAAPIVDALKVQGAEEVEMLLLLLIPVLEKGSSSFRKGLDGFEMKICNQS